MNEMKIFNNNEFGEVRVLQINNEPWWVGKDIADILGYTKLDAMYRIVESEDKTEINPQNIEMAGFPLNGVTLEENPNVRRLILINESGLHSAIFNSKLPSAKKFKRWVTAEVLPSIRKNGAYMTEDTLEQALNNPDFLIKLATNLKQEQEARKQAELIIETQKPKVLFADAVSASKTSILIGDFEQTNKANNKLIHGKYKIMVDEKVSYLLSRDATFICEEKNSSHIELVKNILEDDFMNNINLLGYEASNKGIGWLHIYIDENGKFKEVVIPSEQIIPLWKDSTHNELALLIRVYSTEIWEFNNPKTITNVEVWEENTVKYYRLENSTLIPIFDNHDNSFSHFTKGSEGRGWGAIPFVPFKNNHNELPDIKFVKTLLDNYDLSRSEVANYIEEVKNMIFVLKGYGGENISEFMQKLNEDRAIAIDNPEDGGVDTITPTMDITAIREHYEQLKRDISECGQSVNKDVDKFGSAPSGVAIKFMYTGLDLKCNDLERQFKTSFKKLMHFVNIFLGETGNSSNCKIGIVFNRDIKINESETIENCGKSLGTISKETIISQHPWVKNVELEMAMLEKENEQDLPYTDRIPLNGE